MKKIYLLILLFSVSLLFLHSLKKTDKISGVNLVSPALQVDSTDFAKLKRINTEWVGIIPYAFSSQGQPVVTFDHPQQWWGEGTDGTKELIKLAYQNGYKVMLKPHVWMSSGWIGDYDLSTEEEWSQWGEHYEKYILTFAKIAQEYQVEIFCIGTEYKISTIKQPGYWIDLIGKIKQVYKGELTYAANWDHYENITFWDKLDYIGVDAYFPLSSETHPSSEIMEVAWREKSQVLKQVSKKYDKPILFTEYGYQSVNGAAGEHWTVKKDESQLNMLLQSDAYLCLYNTIWQEEWFSGGFLWKWHLHDNRGGKLNPDWTPQRKPAEVVIKEVYSNGE